MLHALRTKAISAADSSLIAAALWVAPVFATWSQAPDEAVMEAMQAEARALVEGMLGGDEGGEDLGAWAESVLADALSAGPADGNPAGNIVGDATAAAVGESLAGMQRNSAEVIVFMSLAVPERSWRQWSAQAARIGAPIVLRGVVEGGFAATVRAIQARGPLDGAAIDPRLFRLFRIGSVPAVAVVPGGVPPCTSPGCSAEAVPPHDLVTGNVGLDGALEAIAREGGPGRALARRRLAALRGGTQ